MENPSSDSSIKAIGRIKEYPVIKDSFTKAGEYYNWIKEKNSKLNSTLTWTEESLKSVINKVEPVAASKLAPVDNFACSQLDKLENKYPIIKESSENVIKSSNEYYDSSIKPSVDKIVSAKDSAVYIAKTPFRITAQTIQFLSDTTNGFVHHYLSGSAPPPASNGSSTSSEIAEKSKYDDLFGRAVKELNSIRVYSQKNINRLSNILASIYDQSVSKNRERIEKYYREYCEEIKPESGAQSGDSAENQSTLVRMAAHFSNKLRMSARAMSTVCYSHLSSDNQQKMDQIFNKTEAIYSVLSQSNYQDIREKISIDNIKWIGQSTVSLLGNIRESLTAKYRQETGATPPNMETCETEQQQDNHSTTSDDN